MEQRLYFRAGEMAERSNAAVLKTVDCNRSGGSNPSLSAKTLKYQGFLFIMYCTYILKSLKDNGYYFGHCADIEIRLHTHNHGKVRSTKSRRPLVVHYFENFETKSLAYKRELFFKTLQGRNWLKQNKII